MRCTEETLTPLDRLEARHAQPRITRVAPARPAYRPSTQRNPVTQQIVGRPGQIGDLSDELRLNPVHAGKNERGFEAGLARRHMQVTTPARFGAQECFFCRSLLAQVSSKWPGTTAGAGLCVYADKLFCRLALPVRRIRVLTCSL
jgi:hypothetical protein